METPPDSSGQRLRWWHEPAPTAKWYSEPVAPAPLQTAPPVVVVAPLSFEDELEAEAMRRVVLEQDAVVIEGDNTVIQKNQKMLALCMGFSALANLVIGSLSHKWFTMFLGVVMIAEYFWITHILRKQLAAQKPRLTVSSLGLTLQMPFYSIGPVFWNEIAGVRVVNWGIVRFVRVSLKDPKRTLARAMMTKERGWNGINRAIVALSHIEITEPWFASAPEIAALITTFRPADTPK